MTADIKALKAALAERQAELAAAEAQIKSLQDQMDEARHKAAFAREEIAQAEIALRLAQPLGKRLAKLLAESAESGGAWMRFGSSTQRRDDARELRRLGLATDGRRDAFGYCLVITDAGLVKRAEEAGQ